MQLRNDVQAFVEAAITLTTFTDHNRVSPLPGARRVDAHGFDSGD